MPLRVAVVAACPFPFPRGTPVRALRLSEAVARLGHDVHVATYHLGLGAVDSRLHVRRIRGPRWIRPLKPGPTAGKLAVLDPLLYATLRKMLIREGPFDVIHAHHYEGLIVALAARASSPGRPAVVYDAHTLLETELPSYGRLTPGALLSRLGRRLDRALPPRADHIVAVSDLLRSRLLGSGTIPAARITTIGNGLESEAFATRSVAPPAPHGGTIVYAGNLAGYHRVDLLIDAFAHVVRARQRARLRIYTDSPPDAVLRQARALGIDGRLEVHPVPFPELPAALAAADVAVNPRPVCDGVPQKNLNYMAAGLPLVAFRGSLHPYRDGETGVGVDEVQAGALARALLDLLDRPERALRLGEAAQRRATTSLSWEAAARRVERVYESVAVAPPARITGEEAGARERSSR